MQKIYLDMNIYNRPYDDQSQIRIKLETVAIFEILEAMKSGQAHVVWSFILDYENSLNPYEDIRLEIEHISRFAAEMVKADESIRQMAKRYESHGVKPRDALHVACAEASHSAYFVTCDDKLLKKQEALSLTVTLINPLDFILQLGDTNHATAQ